VIISRPRSSLHHVEGGWFRANWHFSFDTYNDPENTWFGDLRVFNDDTLVPGAVWPMHPHRDIEGITYVAEGMFEHADSQGNGGILPPGSAGDAGIGHGALGGQPFEDRADALHPDVDHSPRTWPSTVGRAAQLRRSVTRGKWLPVVVPAPGYGASDAPSNPDGVTVHQDAAVHATLLASEQSVTHRFRAGFNGYLFLVHGNVDVSTKDDASEIDEAGAAKIVDEPEVSVRARDAGAEVLLVETRALDRGG
jgi:redox-sensitive bicupin YhaK (pirin superfamily)